MTLKEIDESQYFSAEQQFHSYHQVRTFIHFAQFWGLIDMRRLIATRSVGFEYEVQAPLFSEWLQFHA